MIYAVFDKFTGAWVSNITDLAQIDPLYYTYQVLPDISSDAATPDEEVQYDPGTQTFVYDYSTLQGILKTQVDLQREQNQLVTITDGFGKAQEYAGKQAEVTLYDIMDPAQFISLSDADLQDKFTYAYRDAYYQGGTVADALERFREGIRTSKFVLAEQAALAQVARTLIKVEQTPIAMRAAVTNYTAVTGTTPAAGQASNSNPINSTIYITDENGEALTDEQNIPLLA